MNQILKRQNLPLYISLDKSYRLIVELYFFLWALVNFVLSDICQPKIKMSQLVLILDPSLLLKQYYDRNFILCINPINVGTISYIENLQRCVMYISVCNLIFMYCLHIARLMPHVWWGFVYLVRETQIQRGESLSVWKHLYILL